MSSYLLRITRTPRLALSASMGFDGFERQLDEVCEEGRFETEWFLDAGEHVVVFLTMSGAARLSRTSVIAGAHVVALRAGRILQVGAFHEGREAYKALVLEE